MNDNDILILIKKGQVTKAFEGIYQNFPGIRKMIVSNGGTMDDAKDIFQDTVIVFYRMSLRPEFQLTSSIGTLLYGISKRMWLKKIRDVKSKEKVLTTEALAEEGRDFLENDELREMEKTKVVEKLLQDLGEPCRGLLEKFYYEKISMKEIALTMGYSNEKTAKAQKYKCIERAKKILGEKMIFLKSLFQ